MLLKNQAKRNCGISSLRLNTAIPSHVGCVKNENHIFIRPGPLIPPNSISCTGSETEVVAVLLLSLTVVLVLWFGFVFSNCPCLTLMI